ncbi:palladin-like [Mytilus edulis]|uniref:palladin-like n=1 Tax=Mytilus edulis TaxID=6550 RepID=UPI0039F04BAC
MPGATTNSHAPLNSTMQKSNYKVLYGGTVTLKCEIEGIPVPFKIQWFKQEGHSPINVTSENTYKYNHNYNNGSEISTASLTILNTDHNDAGVYICTARNINGNAISHTILLEIAGLALDIDPILSASEEFRLAMSYVDFKDDFINYTERTIREMSADFSDFLLHCNFEGRPCSERYCYFINSIFIFACVNGHTSSSIN